jgi:PleD family two-component response regulator
MNLKADEFKILILSENVQYRNTLASKLRIEGFTVEFAFGGFHFLHLIERYRGEFNMVICHENMIDMSADEIISMCRLTKAKSELPIVYISKDNDEEAVCDIILQGANEFVLHSNNMLPVIERARKYQHAQKALKAS